MGLKACGLRESVELMAFLRASSCSGVGNYMYSAVVFSNQCVDEKASGVTFVNSAAEEMVRRRGSTVTGQLVSNKGEQVHQEEEE